MDTFTDKVLADKNSTWNQKWKSFLSYPKTFWCQWTQNVGNSSCVSDNQFYHHKYHVMVKQVKDMSFLPRNFTIACTFDTWLWNIFKSMKSAIILSNLGHIDTKMFLKVKGNFFIFGSESSSYPLRLSLWRYPLTGAVPLPALVNGILLNLLSVN